MGHPMGPKRRKPEVKVVDTAQAPKPTEMNGNGNVKGSKMRGLRSNGDEDISQGKGATKKRRISPVVEMMRMEKPWEEMGDKTQYQPCPKRSMWPKPTLQAIPTF